MNPPPLLVALDLDGTLIDTSLVVRPRVRAAVRAVVERGIPVTLVTGRMYVATAPFAHELGVRGAVGCYQGAAVYDAGSGERLIETPLKHDIAMRVVERAQRDGHYAQLYHDDRFYCVEADTEVRGILRAALRRRAGRRAVAGCGICRTRLDQVQHRDGRGVSAAVYRNRAGGLR